MTVKIALAYDRAAEIRQLFEEYTAMLVADNAGFADYLQLQNYDAEVADLNQKYGLPAGRLYLTAVDGTSAGCVALRRLSADECELKRLYVRPEFRGCGLAGKMLDKVISEAQSIGYKTMLLDTLPSLQAALRLYEKYGFVETTAYNNAPLENTVFLKLDLENYDCR